MHIKSATSVFFQLVGMKYESRRTNFVWIFDHTCTRVVVLPPLPPSSSWRILAESDILPALVHRQSRKTDAAKLRETAVDKELRKISGGRGSDKRLSCLLLLYESQHVAQLALELSSANEARETWTARLGLVHSLAGLPYIIMCICENNCT